MKTLEELKQMQFIPHHDCGCCGAMVVWYPQEPNPYFDPSCDCGSGENWFYLHNHWQPEGIGIAELPDYINEDDDRLEGWAFCEIWRNHD